MSSFTDLGNRIYLIDGHDLNRERRTGTYVIKEQQYVLVETSASPSIPFVLRGLKELDVPLDQISYIILTHIHLDHAGGAGKLLEYCPNAKVIVHPKGARHLSDPSRLIAGAKAVYGESFDTLFDPILPIPKERIIIKNHLETLQLSEDSLLTFYDTPGHANHHMSIHDSVSNGMFTGDTAGIYYRELDQDQIRFFLPSTSPNQFNPEAMLDALSLYEKIGAEKIYFGHYGVSDRPEEVYSQIREWLPVFIETAAEAFHSKETAEQQIAAASRMLLEKVIIKLTELGVPEKHPVYDILSLDLNVSSQGLIDYLKKNNE
ncbi:MBL fold metallo-hydrolase [Bacillus massiliglaciei]|uniref:MBL fold metallo-hydrolase n=1 Tax=Bacillus massiliglaciei TaxID=1816693 RepID=UPI000A508877|nr:MBL fold metallo-hydrolase [Bacillus massiliglaciei]